jgi:hypothetical protein
VNTVVHKLTCSVTAYACAKLRYDFTCEVSIVAIKHSLSFPE